MPRFDNIRKPAAGSSLTPSQPVNDSLETESLRRYWTDWNAGNSEAVAAYSARIKLEGLPLAKYRTFMRGR